MTGSDIRLNRIKLKLHSAPLNDVAAAASMEMLAIKPAIRPGMRIAVAVGSRGVANIAVIVREVVGSLKRFGAEPFIIPAMGSHGGATAEGQKSILEGYGITQEAMGAPIRSSMETVRVGTLPESSGVPVYMDKLAFESDGVFVVNRVKPHTDFHGDNESGVAKMLCIGLGKHAQALATHDYLANGLREYIPKVAEAVIGTGKILGAMAIVEDGYDQTSILRVIPGVEIVAADAELLIKARAMMPSLPFERLDVMMVDRMGKNISGTGMDTNIIGRIGIEGEKGAPPYTTIICLFDLTPESHGNALGIGLADIVPRRLYEKVNWPATYENVITSRFVRRGFVPLIRETDREVVDTALRTCGHINAGTLRLLRIRDTLHIGEILVSDALLKEKEGDGNIELMQSGIPLSFDDAGNLIQS